MIADIYQVRFPFYFINYKMDSELIETSQIYRTIAKIATIITENAVKTTINLIGSCFKVVLSKRCISCLAVITAFFIMRKTALNDNSKFAKFLDGVVGLVIPAYDSPYYRNLVVPDFIFGFILFETSKWLSYRLMFSSCNE